MDPKSFALLLEFINVVAFIFFLVLWVDLMTQYEDKIDRQLEFLNKKYEKFAKEVKKKIKK